MSENRVAIVIGGGSGMGAEAARTLADHGHHVGVLSSSGKGAELGESLGGIGVTGTNRSSDDLKSIIDQAVQRWGRVDVLVNSAGHGPRKPILELTDEDWHEALEVYMLNVVRAARVVTPIMKRQGSGVIINISTFTAFEPDPAFPASSAIRAGLASFTKLFADAHAGDNIRMNNVLPGFVDSFPESPEIRERIPLGRYGTCREIAEVIAFLASDSAAYITGQNLRVDGGLTRSV